MNGIHLLALMSATFILLIISVVAVILKKMREIDSPKPVRRNYALTSYEGDSSKTLQIRYDVGDDRLLISRVSVEMHKSEKGFWAAPAVRANLLAAGDALLRKLPTDIRSCLNCPISCELIARLSSDKNGKDDITPDRARAALAMAEASFVLSDLMLKFVCVGSKQPCREMIFNFHAGVFIIGDTGGNQLYVAERYAVAQISCGLKISMAAAEALWHGIVEILREGTAAIPGIQVIKKSALNSLERSG